MPDTMIRPQNYVRIELDHIVKLNGSAQYKDGRIVAIAWDYDESKVHIKLESGERFSSDFRLPEYLHLCELLFSACVFAQFVRIGFHEDITGQLLSIEIPTQDAPVGSHPDH